MASEERFVSEPTGTGRWPEAIRLQRVEQLLHIRFDDGMEFALSAEYLRVESPSAEVQGHGPGQKRIVAGKAAVAIIGVEPVGNYAVRLRFDDGHDTGLYTWTYLYELGRDRGEKWQAYLNALGERGLSRSST
ncbi:gamma-butyrobetaine hydroxylase-like domain-containing protein [Niveispirillum irakense]|uniref:gamma-butyrobetaine hydroxylase-like domain-containing protein n=1 Tax=Niveispirillum irakense TaxID=34011 RepID=UPI00042593D5|nr:DUF971 domain-containing protein [Niveispirillum irakense]